MCNVPIILYLQICHDFNQCMIFVLLIFLAWKYKTNKSSTSSVGFLFLIVISTICTLLSSFFQKRSNFLDLIRQEPLKEMAFSLQADRTKVGRNCNQYQYVKKTCLNLPKKREWAILYCIIFTTKKFLTNFKLALNQTNQADFIIVCSHSVLFQCFC